MKDPRIRNRSLGQNTDEYWRIEETCCHSNSSVKLSANAGVKI